MLNNLNGADNKMRSTEGISLRDLPVKQARVIMQTALAALGSVTSGALMFPMVDLNDGSPTPGQIAYATEILHEITECFIIPEYAQREICECFDCTLDLLQTHKQFYSTDEQANLDFISMAYRIDFTDEFEQLLKESIAMIRLDPKCIYVTEAPEAAEALTNMFEFVEDCYADLFTAKLMQQPCDKYRVSIVLNGTEFVFANDPATLKNLHDFVVAEQARL